MMINKKISLVLGSVVIVVSVLIAVIQYNNARADRAAFTSGEPNQETVPSYGSESGTPNNATNGTLNSAQIRQAGDEIEDEYEDESEGADDGYGGTVNTAPARTAVPAVPAAANAPSPNAQVSPTPSAGRYTIAQVATHNKRSDCWATVNGAVYDFTAWIAGHPGGQDAIISMCGKDGSAAFNSQHGGQSNPMAALANFKIGTFVR